MLFFILSVFFSYASVPSLEGYLNDYAGVFSKQKALQVNALLQDFDQKTGNQVFVLTTSSLDGKSIEEYSIELAENWKAGTKGKDNGVIIVFAPNEHKVRIEVGYGLEGVLPDILASNIIRKSMLPYFKEGKYEEGLIIGILSVIKVVAPEYKPSIKVHPIRKKQSSVVSIVFFLIMLLFFFISPRTGILFMFFGGGFSGSSDDGFGSFSGGSGGGFGGGGASGSW